MFDWLELKLRRIEAGRAIHWLYIYHQINWTKVGDRYIRTRLLNGATR